LQTVHNTADRSAFALHAAWSACELPIVNRFVNAQTWDFPALPLDARQQQLISELDIPSLNVLTAEYGRYVAV
jgi:hypothetical protein